MKLHIGRKRFFFLCLLMMVLGLTGCGNEDGKEPPKIQANNSSFKVGIIYAGDPSTGAGYDYSHAQGIIEMQSDLSLADEQIISKINVPDTDYVAVEAAIKDCIKKGCTLIYATSFGYMNIVEKLAKKYPDIIFSNAAGFKSNGMNFNNYFGRLYQASYLTGIAAGLKTKSDKIGYVAARGKENSEEINEINGFAMGVESVNSVATVYLKLTKSMNRVEAEKKATQELIAMGCDVLTQHQNSPTVQKIAEEKKVFGSGYMSDMTEFAPKAHLTAATIYWGLYYTKTTKAVMDGTFQCKNYYGSMNDGFIDITPLTANCSEETEEIITQAKNRIVLGENKIFEGELRDNNGRVVCKKGEDLTSKTSLRSMNWYYENIMLATK